jgi:hypothetical protein
LLDSNALQRSQAPRGACARVRSDAPPTGHLAELDEELTAASGVEVFAGCLQLEDRLFKQLDELVYAKGAQK